MSNFYKYVSNFSGQSLFMYVCIIIICIVFFRKLRIRLNIVVGLIVALVVILYLHSKRSSENIGLKKQLKKKNKSLNVFEKEKLYNNKRYFKLIDLLYALSDLKFFNNRNYTLFMLCIKEFIQLDQTFKKLLDSNTDYFYLKNNILFQIEYKNKALFYLRSLSLETNIIDVLDKINKGMISINDILNCYINNNIKKDNRLKNLNSNIQAFNSYFN